MNEFHFKCFFLNLNDDCYKAEDAKMQIPKYSKLPEKN